MDLQAFHIVREGVSVVLQMEALIEDDRKIAGICGLSGAINLRPKAWLRAVRDEVSKLEVKAREAGCVEMRIGGKGGRAWGRVLPDYSPLNGQPDIVTKRL